MTVEIRALAPDDNRQDFVCRDDALTRFFRSYAGQNQFRHHVGVSYVAVEQAAIVGFVTVAPASLDADHLPSGKRVPPYPLPVLRLARLAVDNRHEGRGIGKSLLRFTCDLALRMREEYGCVGILVDAKPDAQPFYAAFGFEFVECVEGAQRVVPELTLMYLPLGSIPGWGGKR